MKFNKIVIGIILLLIILFPLNFYFIFQVAPTEKIMGDVQRIFYLHIALALSSYIGFGVLFFASIMFLIKRNLRWDLLASAAGEIGLLFSTLVLITGSLWARPVWNVWWTWDPRLVTMLILWFIFIGYFLLRKATADRIKKAQYSAVIGIIGFLDVPVVRLATKWWRSIHPRLQSKHGGLDPLMTKVMLFSILTFFLFTIAIIFIRFNMALTEDKLNKLLIRLEEENG